MFDSLKYVFNQHINNIYRIVSVTRYERISENRDSNLGSLWNILSPLIQIFTYWFVFGLGLRGGKAVNGVPYIQWMLSGLIPWFFLSACIKKGTSAILDKIRVLEKMNFPMSILVTTSVLNELITHLIMVLIMIVCFLFMGYKPDLNLVKIVYYIFCGVAFSISFGMLFSVLTMLARDVKKLISSSIRMLFYVTPILWTMDKLPETIKILMTMLNPLYYVIEGYRLSLFPQLGNMNPAVTIYFWITTVTLYILGCKLMYKNRYRFIDLA